MTVAAGLTVMVNTCGVPVQPFSEGVTVMVVVVGLDTLAAVKLMLPEPVAGNPMPGLLLVQLSIGFPEGLVNVMVTVLPAQALWFPGLSTAGAGLTVMVKVTGVPGQPLRVGVMVMVATCWLDTLAAVKLMFPLPEAPSPIAVLSLVQLKVAPGVPVIGMLTFWPAQGVASAGGLAVGAGLMVTVNCSWSEQPGPLLSKA